MVVATLVHLKRIGLAGDSCFKLLYSSECVNKQVKQFEAIPKIAHFRDSVLSRFLGLNVGAPRMTWVQIYHILVFWNRNKENELFWTSNSNWSSIPRCA
jgi:hypothetical protein